MGEVVPEPPDLPPASHAPKMPSIIRSQLERNEASSQKKKTHTHTHAHIGTACFCYSPSRASCFVYKNHESLKL